MKFKIMKNKLSLICLITLTSCVTSQPQGNYLTNLYEKEALAWNDAKITAEKECGDSNQENISKGNAYKDRLCKDNIIARIVEPVAVYPKYLNEGREQTLKAAMKFDKGEYTYNEYMNEIDGIHAKYEQKKVKAYSNAMNSYNGTSNKGTSNSLINDLQQSIVNEQARQNIEQEKELLEKMYVANPDYAKRHEAAKNGVYLPQEEKAISCGPNSVAPVGQPKCEYICLNRVWTEICN